MKRLVLALVALAGAALVLQPPLVWDGQEEFVLTLAEPAAADTERLLFRPEGDYDAGQRLCEFYRGQDIADIEPQFRPVSVASGGTFTVAVPTGGTARLWGSRQTQRRCKFVILMATSKSGQQAFACVPVGSAEPIELKWASSLDSGAPAPNLSPHLDQLRTEQERP